MSRIRMSRRGMRCSRQWTLFNRDFSWWTYGLFDALYPKTWFLSTI